MSVKDGVHENRVAYGPEINLFVDTTPFDTTPAGQLVPRLIQMHEE